MSNQNNFITPEKNKKEDLEKIDNSFNVDNSFDLKTSSLEKTETEKPNQGETVKKETEKKLETEKQPESTEKRDNLDTKIDLLKKKLSKQKKKKIEMPLVKDELTVRIEEVMEAGLEDAFQELTPIEQQEFKIKGEETAWKIRQLLKKTHVKIKEIFKLLFEWLKILPGINKFFLEQEAKIKADKIFSLRKK